jgi:hypothetical protein
MSLAVFLVLVLVDDDDDDAEREDIFDDLEASGCLVMGFGDVRRGFAGRTSGARDTRGRCGDDIVRSKVSTSSIKGRKSSGTGGP